MCPNLPSNASYMNDLEISADAPETEDLWSKVGSNVNYLLDRAALGVTTFTSSGSFTTLEGQFRVYLILVGGGAGGSNGVTNTSGGAGGSGGAIWDGIIDVAESTIYSITVGSGGGPFSNGVASSFGAIASAPGGLAQTLAAGSTAIDTFWAKGGGRAATPGGGGAYFFTAQDGKGANGAGSAAAGGGGGGSYGAGGNGATSAGIGVPVAGSSAGANTGGGGGGSVNGGTAGSGGSGIVKVYSL